MRALILAILTLATTLTTAAPTRAAPRVLADIPPVHALVASVMQGVATPGLLMRPGDSAHGLNLRPSQAGEAEQADVIFWVGPALSPALERPLSVLGSRARIVTLMDLPETTLLDATPGEADDHGAEEAGDAHGPADPHVWLDPANARAWLAQIAEALAAADPASADTYRANAASTAARLDALSAAIAASLAPRAGTPYLATHRAFAYFDARFGLAPVATLSDVNATAPGPRAVRALRDAAANGITCLITEPETTAATVATLSEGTALVAYPLDPLGRAIPPGPGLYEALLQGIADTYAACLG